MEPKFRHDCDACIFLGRLELRGLLQADAYFCPREFFGGSIVLRHGSDGPDYSSMAIKLIPGDDDQVWQTWNTAKAYRLAVYLTGFYMAIEAWNGGDLFEDIPAVIERRAGDWKGAFGDIIAGAAACVEWLNGWKDEPVRGLKKLGLDENQAFAAVEHLGAKAK